jgi:predicted RNA binding protein YcfA (HicA-like mRNA interferase family)
VILVSDWPSSRANAVLGALLRIGWQVNRQTGSHKVLVRQGWPNFIFAFHEREELGPKMLANCQAHRLDTRRPLTPKPNGGTTATAGATGCPVQLAGFTAVNADGVNGTTGGGNATPTTVTTYAAFKAAVQDSAPRVVVVSGTIKTTDGDGFGLKIASNKTIMGANKSATIYGGLAMQLGRSLRAWQRCSAGQLKTSVSSLACPFCWLLVSRLVWIANGERLMIARRHSKSFFAS